MTKEETAWAATLNLIGSDVLDGHEDAELISTLNREHGLADNSTGPNVILCPRCSHPIPFDGPQDAEHYAELAIHLSSRHDEDAWTADAEATTAWNRTVATFEGVLAA